MTSYTYPFLDISERAGKPRTRGLTMAHDGRISPDQFKSALETAAPYIDYYKF